MCVFFPLALGLMAAVWALPVSLEVAVAWDLALLVALGVMVAPMRKAPDTLGGVPLSELAGRPCPSCASTQTVAWMSGRTPLGVHCQRCNRRTPGVPALPVSESAR